MTQTVTILGINGHVGHAAAQAFAAAGWRVIGFGRSNKRPLAGVEFMAGDAADGDALKAATQDADVVFNGLNLPYDKWYGGAAEKQLGRVIDALSDTGKTLLFPGNIYNYSARERVITPQTRQVPQTERGAIRVRMEDALRDAAQDGAFQVIILRAGDFYGPSSSNDWFDLMILREVAKRKVALSADRSVTHAWAYLPDLSRAFVALAQERAELGAFETFHFAGHAVSADRMFAAIQRAAPMRLRQVAFPWAMISAMGLVMPLMREIVKMRYLWENEMVLRDTRLDTLLGPDFGTPFETAVGETVRPFFAPRTSMAA